MLSKMAAQVRHGRRSASMKTPSAAAIRGAVASAVTTTVIEVSIVAKLNAMALKKLATMMMMAGPPNRAGSCARARRGPSRMIQKTIRLKPISTPRQKVSPQPSRPDSLIKSVSGVMISAPASAITRPRAGRGVPLESADKAIMFRVR